MKVIQIAPSIGPGSGVAGVAHHLEQEWRALGVETLSFTAADSRAGWIPSPAGPIAGRIALLVRVGWFSTAGTLFARRMLAQHPEAISICHNDVLAGDVYVNHGIVHTAFIAQGHRLWRTMRNPLHAFTGARDAVRYGSRRWHRVVVNLVESEEADLRSIYPAVRIPTRVIGNGVDTTRYRPPTDEERARARRSLGLGEDDFAILFIGHEFERKGLPPLVEAVAAGPGHWHLIVVGGDANQTTGVRRTAAAETLGGRLHLLGRRDPRESLHAADVLASPSAYESYGLVVLEALASGVPVVATPTGCVPDVLADSQAGSICGRSPDSIRSALLRVEEADAEKMSAAAREVGLAHGWTRIAERYLDLFTEVAAARPTPTVVHAIRSDAFAGVERHVAALAGAQAARGDHVTVIGGDPTSMRSALPASVTVVPARTVTDVAAALARLAATRRPDVVHTHMSAADTAAAISWLRGARLVSTRHMAAGRGTGLLRRSVMRMVETRIRQEIAVGAHVAEHSPRAHVVAPGVPVAGGLAGVDRRPSAADRQPLVLIAQRLEPEKDTDVALRAFAESGLAEGGWRLQVAGDGSLRAALENLAASLGISSATDFLGHREDVPDLMAQASMLIAPCAHEGLGLTVIEAMAAELPVVAAAAGGHLETVGAAPGAALFEPGDAGAAADLVRALADDAGRREALAHDQLVQQQKSYSLDAQLTQTDAVYRRAVSGGRPRATASRSLVLVSLEAWDEVWRRNQHLVARLLRRDPGLRVLILEPAIDPLHDLARGERPRRGRGLRRGPILPGLDPDALWLWEPTKTLPRRVDPGQDRRWAATVPRLVRRLRMERPTLWVNDPRGVEVLPLTRWPSVYDITDDWLEADRDPASRALLEDQERRLLAEVEEVTVCSPSLAAGKIAAGTMTVIPNAVDTAEYLRPRPRPHDLPAGPVALYVGTLHADRLDVTLCVQTAGALPAGARLVLLGPDALDPADRRRLDDAGVIRLGPRDRASVPGYLQHADVLVVPHVVDAFTDSLDPIKLYEYRAVGRRVVSTAVAGFRDLPGGRVTVSTASAFPVDVARLLPARDVFPAGVDAGVPTWDQRADAFAEVLARVAAHGAEREPTPTQTSPLTPSASAAGAMPGPVAQAEVPWHVRVEMCHHVVAHLADEAGVDALHIKGLALDPALRYRGRMGSDVDVLVRPSHVRELLRALRAAGFELLGRFETSSPFEHAATLHHPEWGYVDLHRLFPGIALPPAEAFDILWDHRGEIELAGRACPVPDRAAQALILVLHAARSRPGGQAHQDLAHLWHHTTPDPWPEVRALARELDAEVALASVLDEASDPTRARERALWEAVRAEGSRVEEWRARVAAAPGPAAKLRLVVRMPLVNTDHLALEMGRRPTPTEVSAEFIRRARVGTREILGLTRRRGPA